MTTECKVNETPACCCADVGTIIDGSNCSVDFSRVYASESEAKAALDYLTQKARAAETDPCQIHSQINQVENGVELTASFLFCCEAESLIFQLSTR